MVNLALTTPPCESSVLVNEYLLSHNVDDTFYSQCYHNVSILFTSHSQIVVIEMGFTLLKVGRKKTNFEVNRGLISLQNLKLQSNW